MSKTDDKELLRFLQPYPPEVIELAITLRNFVWDAYPTANELIYDNYNAVAFGWSLTDRLSHTFCSIAAFSDFVHFGFYYGTQIADPEKKLLGKGNQYRYLKLRSEKEFPKAYIKKLLKEAYANSLAKVKDKSELKKGLTIVKCSLAKKQRPVKGGK
ncbi:MAG: DUF1801 domain-containing protein [Chitinophagaceae bacterium]|nr:DUF1801 domain-containing protein [Chitinophagaceae bacterium]